MSSTPQAFTVEYNGIANALATNCGICEAYNPAFQQGQRHPPISEFKALWDTGAMGSVVSTNVVQTLGLKSTGKARVFHANGESIVNTYSINILLPNQVAFSTLRVTEGVLNDTDVLIGMDIISRNVKDCCCIRIGTEYSTNIVRKQYYNRFQLNNNHLSDNLQFGCCLKYYKY